MTKKIACFILMLVLPVLTSAQEKPQTNDILFQRMLYIEGGYFIARRGDFRELYNSKITPAISLEFRKNRKFGYGVRLNFNYFDQDLKPGQSVAIKILMNNETFHFDLLRY